jgi:N-acetylneuraminate synthase
MTDSVERDPTRKDMPLFVAEVSSNHNRDLDRCFSFIDKASEIGCQAVKFQLFKVEELFAPEILSVSERHRKRKEWELPVEYLPELAGRCREREIQFACSPFYMDSVEELLPYVAFYKVASYELLWNDLLIACAQTGKPVVLSTGMATMEEVKRAVEVLRLSGCRDLTLLHCVSSYPTPPDQCNLRVIETLREEFSCPVGWSDHSVSPGVIRRAVNRWGAAMIEFHLDLEGEGEEFGSGHCWLPGQMADVVGSTDDGLPEADGNGLKEPASSELEDRDWRADPTDGLRPLRHIRDSWHG